MEMLISLVLGGVIGAATSWWFSRGSSRELAELRVALPGEVVAALQEMQARTGQLEIERDVRGRAMAVRPKNLRDEHLSDAERDELWDWETKILTHLAVTPESPSGVLDLHPILVKQPSDMAHYFNAINFLRDKGLITHFDGPPPAMQITEDGLDELRRLRR